MEAVRESGGVCGRFAGLAELVAAGMPVSRYRRQLSCRVLPGRWPMLPGCWPVVLGCWPVVLVG